MPFAELRNRMTAREFTEWVGFYSYESKMRDEAEREARRS